MNVLLRHHKYYLVLRFERYKSYFITTPIFYCNDKPHIGHAYSLCLADVFARWNRINNRKVVFSVGTDDHGLKIQKRAEALGKSPEVHVATISKRFKEMIENSNTSYSDFIQTSNPEHKGNVQEIWRIMSNKNYLTKSKYSGWYSIYDEAFISDVKLCSIPKPDLEDSNKYEWISEDNWIFDIRPFKSTILEWLSRENVIYPKSHLPAIKEMLDHTSVLSVSRPRNRVHWGIPVTDDPSHTIYVWFDALLNYLTVGKKHNVWPPDLQIVGKDIARFHTIVWPAILLALNLELPKKILIHSHWMKDGVKMSKSMGNIVDFEVAAEDLGGYEQLRYYLLSNDTITSDNTYDRKLAVKRVNADLVNLLCNLLSRIASPKINPTQNFGFTGVVTEDMFPESIFGRLIKSIEMLPNEFTEHLEQKLSINHARDKVTETLHLANAFLNEQEPWKRVRDFEQRQPSSSSNTLDYSTMGTIYVCAETVRICTLLMQCLVPQLSSRIFNILGVPELSQHLLDTDCLKFDYNATEAFSRSYNIPEKIVLMNRIKI